MAAPHPPSATGRPAGHLAVLVAFLALGAAVGSWGARIPDVRDALGLTEGALGSALLGLSIGAVVGSWAGGLLVRRLGSPPVVLGAWVAIGLAVMVPGRVDTWGALAASLLAFGLAIGVLDVSINGAGVQLEADAGRPLLSGLHAGWSGGVLLGAAIGSVAVHLEVTPAAHLAAVGVAVVVAGLVVGRDSPVVRSRSDDDLAVDGSTAAGTGGRRLAALAAIGGCIFLAEGAILDWSGVLVREDLDGGAFLGSLAVTGVAAGGLLGRLVGDGLSARWGAPRLVRGGVVLAVVAFAAALLTPVAASVPLLLVAVGAGLAPSVPLAFAAAGRSFGESGIATVTTAGYGAYLAGPALIGWLAEVTALRAALVVPLVLMASVAGLAWSTAVPAGVPAPEPPHPEPV